jgi:hypothetical protein
MESATLSKLPRAKSGRRTAGELVRPLGLHAALLIAYLGIFSLILDLTARSFSLDSTAFGAAIFLAAWMLFVMVPTWIVLAVALYAWWRQGRQGLVRRALIWDSLLWLGVFLLLLLPWRKNRRVLIPPRPEA